MSQERYIPILVHMDGEKNLHMFYRTLLRRGYEALSELGCQGKEVDEFQELKEREEISGTDLIDVFQRASSKYNVKFVLLLDSFYYTLLTLDRFGQDLLSTLRNFRQEADNNKRVPTIISAIEPIENYAERVRFDAFPFNDLRDIRLGRFQSEEEARELLSIPHDRTFTEEEIQIGLNAGERHPFRLQWAGWFLYGSKGEGGGKYHDEQGNLIDGAEEKLKEDVDEEYKEMMRRSGVAENSGAVRKKFSDQVTGIWKKLTD